MNKRHFFAACLITAFAVLPKASLADPREDAERAAREAREQAERVRPMAEAAERAKRDAAEAAQAEKRLDAEQRQNIGRE